MVFDFLNIACCFNLSGAATSAITGSSCHAARLIFGQVSMAKKLFIDLLPESLLLIHFSLLSAQSFLITPHSPNILQLSVCEMASFPRVSPLKLKTVGSVCSDDDWPQSVGRAGSGHLLGSNFLKVFFRLWGAKGKTN